MASGTLIADAIQSSTPKSRTVDQLCFGAAKAWINFNGTGTVAIRASFNVTSLTDNGTGDYSVNFTNALADANYAAAACSRGAAAVSLVCAADDVTARTTTLFRLNTITITTGVAVGDHAYVNVAFLGT